MKIVFLDRETMGASFDPLKLSSFGQYHEYPLTAPGERLSRILDAAVVLTNRVKMDADLLSKTSNIKMIIATAVGTNHIDVDYCKQNGILVRNCAGYSTETVAQHTLGLVLALSRNLKDYHRHVSSGAWEDDLYTVKADLPIEDIHEKRWGIIGLGNIGKKVASLAQAIGCDVMYHSTSGLNDDADYKQVDLSTLMSSCQIISIHCPLNEQTRHLIDRNALAHVKEGSVLINVARGSVVDEEALVEVFDEKLLRLGWDVFSHEPMSPKDPLMKIKDSNRVLFTPHVAWTSKSAKKVLSEMIQAHIQSLQI